MKSFKISTWMITFLLALPIPLWAGHQITLNFMAEVGEEISLNVGIFKMDSSGNPVGSDLAPLLSFGTLISDGSGGLKGSESFLAVVAAGASGRPYQITSSMQPLQSGVDFLPNAVMLLPLSAVDSNGADISADTINTNGRAAVGEEISVYSSGSVGRTAVVKLAYSIPGGASPFAGAERIWPDQPAGEYLTSVFYTLTLV